MTQSELTTAIKNATGENLKSVTSENLADLNKYDEQFDNDDYNPAFALSNIPNSLLALIAKGEINAKELAKETLKQRGYDIEGKWIGFK